MVKQAIAGLANVEVEAYSGLTVDFASKVGAQVMVRGLRMSSDFFLSSSLLKEVAQLEGCLDGMVPEHVAVALRAEFFK